MSSLDTKESEKNNNEDMNKPTTNVPVFMQQLRGPLKSLVERGGTKTYEVEINKYKEEMNKAKQSDPMPAWLANEMKVLGRYTSNESNNSPALEAVKTTSSSLPSLNPGDRSPRQNYNQKKNDQDGSVPKISAVELKKDNEETVEVKQTSPFRTAKMPEWLITELKLRAKLKDTESIVPKSPSTKYQTASNTDPIQEASNTDPIQEASNTATIINSNTSNFNTTGNTVDKMNPPKHQVQNDDMQEMARKIALLTQYMEKLTQRFDNLESLLMNVLDARKKIGTNDVRASTDTDAEEVVSKLTLKPVGEEALDHSLYEDIKTKEEKHQRKDITVAICQLNLEVGHLWNLENINICDPAPEKKTDAKIQTETLDLFDQTIQVNEEGRYEDNGSTVDADKTDAPLSSCPPHSSRFGKLVRMIGIYRFLINCRKIKKDHRHEDNIIVEEIGKSEIQPYTIIQNENITKQRVSYTFVIFMGENEIFMGENENVIISVKISLTLCGQQRSCKISIINPVIHRYVKQRYKSGSSTPRPFSWWRGWKKLIKIVNEFQGNPGEVTVPYAELDFVRRQ